MLGRLIVIDGCDGSGKTTQTNILVERLRNEGFEVEMADFPQYNNKSAGLVENYLEGKYGGVDDVDSKVASIFYACDRYDASFKIRQWLTDGKIVISNRYVSSSMGHQGSKILDDDKRQELFAWLYNLEYELFKIPKPDLSIILHVPADISQKLSQGRDRQDWENKSRDIHQENLKHLELAEQTYLEMANNFEEFEIIECVLENKILEREIIAEMVYAKIKQII